jgi:hypothetical protein
MGRIIVVQGTSQTVKIDLTKPDGDPLPMGLLVGAVATFTVRTAPTAITNAIFFTTAANPQSLYFGQYAPVLTVALAPGDTSGLMIAEYFYQVQLTLADGAVSDVIPWTPFDVTLGGSATPPPPPFTNTIQIDENYQIPGQYLYVTPGGSPICNAQIRLYYQSDYLAGNLSSPVATTTTNACGGFTNPLLVNTGYSYVLRWEDPGLWGPDIATVVA